MIVLDSPMLEAIVASLGWTLLHFLWQGAVIGVFFGLALAAAGRSSARMRYRIALSAMLLLAICPVATFLWLLPQAPPPVELAAAIVAPAAEAVLDTAPASLDWRAVIDPWVPWTVLAWALGVVIYTGRLLLEWRDIRKLSRVDVELLPEEWQVRVARLTRRLGVSRAVMVLQSAHVHVPLVIGFFKPLILVPVTAFTGLTPWQLELILMHELAHIRRHDYLVNLLQVVVETLLFYHPVVRWVSRVAREEREHCCDDLVVARSGDALSYARALAELATAQSLGLQTSVGSDGGKLLTRIKRIVAAREPSRVSTHWSVGTMLAVVAVTVSGMLQPTVDAGPGYEPEEVSLAAIVPPAPAIDARPSFDALREVVQTIPTLPAAAEGESETKRNSAEAARVLSAMAEAVPRSAGSVQDPEAGVAKAVAQVQADSAPVYGSAPVMPEVQAQVVAPQPVVPEPVTTAAVSIPTSPARTPAPSTVPDNQSASGSASAPEQESERSGPAARRIAFRAPEFPQDARLEGIEGWVRFTYTIGRKGNVSDVRILDAYPRYVFEQAVKRAVRQWRFEPVLQDGVPVERDVTQTIEFALGKATDDEQSPCVPGTGTRLCRKKEAEE
jgi:bla regulator protein BlaR1